MLTTLNKHKLKENYMENRLAEVLKMLGKNKLSVNEQWMFDNYWNNSEYELKKDNNGKLWVHKI